MGKTFTYNLYKRWVPLPLLLPCLFITYAFFREAFYEGNILFVVLCTLVSMSYAIIVFRIWNEVRTKIMVSEDYIVVKKGFFSVAFCWTDIAEYGRDRVLVSGGGAWRYYFKSSRSGNKKYIICKEDLRDFDALNQYIRRKVPSVALRD